jgi:DNA-binding transcriptional MerR regulator
MDGTTPLTVGELARLSGITVRTLHHYDEIGLVVPGERSESGYRLYGEDEIARLQEVLLFRELGIGLGDIGRIIDEPAYRRDAALRRHKDLLLEKADRLLAVIDAVDRAIEAEKTGARMTPEEMVEVFGDFDPSEHEQEAEERWGGTEAYAESIRRTGGYAKGDWEHIQREAGAINQAMVDLMAGGVPADAPEAMDLAEKHRAHITRWFYECTPAIHAGLGEMYVADQRFKNNIDRAGEGLAEYLSAAIAANADRL